MTQPIPSFDVERWQSVQDVLTEVLGVHVGLVDSEGRPLTRLVDVLRSPWNVLTSSPKGFSRYAECIQSLLTEARKSPRPLVCMQVAGLHLCVVPIEREASPTLYFVLGPSLVGRRGEPDDYIALAKEFDIRIDQWMEALQEIKIFSHVGINSVASLLGHLAEFVFPRKQMAFLERLLDASLQAVHAEAGSILVSGQGSEELFIQVARGLKPDVVRTARVRVGEGLAGIAAAERTPLRVNRQTADLRIQQAMQRPEIEDAMVVPMTRGSQLLGVLCVNRSRGSPPLREDGIALLQQFTGLAQEALS